jgi:hypothetical protein
MILVQGLLYIYTAWSEAFDLCSEDVLFGSTTTTHMFQNSLLTNSSITALSKAPLNNSIQFFIIYVPSQQLQGQLQTQHSVDIIIKIIQFNSIYLCAKLNSPEDNYKVSTGKKMRRIRSKKVSENNVLIRIKIIKYKMTMSTLLLS